MAATIDAGEAMTVSPRFRLLSSRFFVVSLLVIAALSATLQFVSNASAESPMPHTSRTTMVILSDRAMREDQWTALVNQLHRSQARLETTVRDISGELDVLRERDVEVGMSVEVVITVYLVGDCTLLPGRRTTVGGALGWVKKVDGEIQPFVHVDCARLVEMLRPLALGMSRERRNTVMAEAIATVIAHEWIHIATQNMAHEKCGVMQPRFEVKDLLAGDEHVNLQDLASRERKKTSGF
jgi:hypothetical protein